MDAIWTLIQWRRTSSNGSQCTAFYNLWFHTLAHLNDIMMCGKGSNYNEVDINLREYIAYYYWKYD